MSKDYSKLDQCVHGGVYRIRSRNLSVGVFNEKNNGFIGIREKFDSLFLFTEFHYDIGEPFGTVMPDELIEMLPKGIEVEEGHVGETSAVFVSNIALFEYLSHFSPFTPFTNKSERTKL